MLDIGNELVLAYERCSSRSATQVVINFTDEPQRVTFDLMMRNVLSSHTGHGGVFKELVLEANEAIVIEAAEPSVNLLPRKALGYGETGS